MTLGNAYWILMFFLILCCGWVWYPARSAPMGAFGLIVFILLGILGWHDFGAPIHG